MSERQAGLKGELDLLLQPNMWGKTVKPKGYEIMKSLSHKTPRPSHHPLFSVPNLTNKLLPTR